MLWKIKVIFFKKTGKDCIFNCYICHYETTVNYIHYYKLKSFIFRTNGFDHDIRKLQGQMAIATP